MTQTPREQGNQWRRRDDAQVYLALERARRLCDRLLEVSDGPPPGRDALAAVGTELGLAAFVASEHLDADQRDALRREAHASPIDRPRPLDAMAQELSALVSAVGRLAHDTQDAAICEELHLAGLHIDDALHRLGIGAPRRGVAWSRW